MIGRPVFFTTIGAEATGDDTGVVLVDLSDTTNYKHSGTAELHLCSIDLNTDVQSGTFDFWFGVVTEVDATDGSVTWFHIAHVEKDSHLSEFLDYTLKGLNPNGLELTISSGSLTKYVSGLSTADSSIWQTDTGLLSPVGAAGGATGKPGAGDLVLWVEEVTAGTADWNVTVGYWTA